MGLDPIASSLCSLLGLWVLIRHLETITGETSFKSILFYGFLFSFSITIFAFTWIFTAAQNLTGASWPVVCICFLVYGLFSFYKIFFFYIGKWAFERFRKEELPYTFFLIIGYPSLSLISDWLSPMIFPVYWGDFFRGNSILRQFASAAGVEGLGAVGWFFAATSYHFFRIYRENKSKGKQTNPSTAFRKLNIALISTVLLILSYDVLVLFRTPETQGEIFAAAIQPNPSFAKLELRENKEYIGKTLQTVLDMGKEAILRSPKAIDLLIFPESSVPFHGTSQKEESKETYSSTFLGILEYLSKTGNTTILFNELILDDGTRNSAGLLNFERQSVERYYKQKLLPFGEYLPFESSLPILRNIFPEASSHKEGKNSGMFVLSKSGNIPGTNRNLIERISENEDLILNPVSLFESEAVPKEGLTLSTSQFFISSLICYEVMDPDLVQKRYGTGSAPDLIVNLTNDSWFQSERESYQHSGAAMMRAIETGTPIVRSAVSGVTQIFDPWGREIVEASPFEKEAIIYVNIPIIRGGIPTLFRNLGPYPFRIIAGLSLIFAFLAARGLFPLSKQN
ncbi:apolipoprotein N-acyltransferase [Leptospira idonii]|uniref:Apolipoprotein N-acyltransferase n=1 Tax=Leptospira idonii TaxID=1193500 RepID=A0A4V3JYE4_9LEPT|nr:nitrilase-related carbon-nitrogen hydrolase [Leptospira idonii]TGN20766.1 hypothetical protein EHS15_02600 [Leptospira idonii]